MMQQNPEQASTADTNQTDKTPGSYSVRLAHDGTRTGFILAMTEFLRTAPDDVVSASLVFEGELITITADQARAPKLLT